MEKKKIILKSSWILISQVYPGISDYFFNLRYIQEFINYSVLLSPEIYPSQKSIQIIKVQV